VSKVSFYLERYSIYNATDVQVIFHRRACGSFNMHLSYEVRAMNELASYTIHLSANINSHSTLSTPDNLVLRSHQEYTHIHTLCTFSIHIKLHWHTQETRGQKKNNNKK